MIKPPFKRACRILSGCLLICLAGLAVINFGPDGVSPSVVSAAPSSGEPTDIIPSQQPDSRRYLWENGIKIERRQITDPNSNATITFPVISGLKNQTLANSLNQQLEQLLRAYGAGKSLSGQAPLQQNGFHVRYTVTTNYNNLLGLSIHRWLPANTNYQDPEPEGGLLYELQTGRRLGLNDLFNTKTDYRSQINNEISRQIFARQLDETVLRQPFQGIDSQPLFYLQPDGVAIFFRPDNRYFSATKYSYYWYFDRSYREFFVPFHRLTGVVIYDRFGSPSPSLYGQTKLQKYMLPNDLVLKPQAKSYGEGEKYREVQYLAVSDYQDQLVETRINQTLEAEADRILTKSHSSYVTMRTTGNFGGYLSVMVYEYNRQGNDLSHALCFDLKTGQIARLGDLFKSWANAKEIIGRAIVKAYGAKHYHGFDALEAQTSFSFNETEVKIYFAPGLPLLKGRTERFLTFLYEDFGGQDQLKIFD